MNKPLEIQYNSSDYISFIETVAAALNVKPKDNFITVPSVYGTGFLWAVNLPEGMSLMVSDFQLKDEVVFQRVSSTVQNFILQFNEAVTGEQPIISRQTDGLQSFSLVDNVVLLTTSIMTSKFIVPGGVRLRSVKLMFEKKHLLQFFDNDTIDALISKYFSKLLKKGNVEPIDADYRILMNELIKDKIDHPFRMHFIENRMMLLLERFVRKFLNKIYLDEDNYKFTEDEVSRLMRVEALLVKDFQKAPPTIANLSRFAAMSPTKLKTDFKALYGMPIYEYYQKNRMMHAKSLLLENKYTIKEVGNMVGYTNLGHFAGSFKKEFSLLPSELSVTSKVDEANFSYNEALPVES